MHYFSTVSNKYVPEQVPSGLQTGFELGQAPWSVESPGLPITLHPKKDKIQQTQYRKSYINILLVYIIMKLNNKIQTYT